MSKSIIFVNQLANQDLSTTKFAMRQIIFLLGGVLFIFSCCKDNVEPKVTDPKQALLGQWEEIEDSFGPVTKPSGYDEYLPDSVRKSYSYVDKIFYYEKYWIQDSLFFRSFKYVDPYDGTTTVFKWSYQFKFITRNKLQLEFQAAALNRLSIYKRIK